MAINSDHRKPSSRPSVGGSPHVRNVQPRAHTVRMHSEHVQPQEPSAASMRSPRPRHAVATAEGRKQRWIAYAAIFAVVAIAFGFGVGSVVTDGFLKPPKSDIAAASAEHAEGNHQEDIAQGDSSVDQGGRSDTVYPDAASLEWRDTEFEVNPDRRDWSYSDNGRKTVYLTIDDGPSENTQAVLDILDQYNCKATFFVVGHNDDYFPMIAEAYKRGHTIGLHSMTHDYAQVYASIDAYFADLDGIAQVVRDQIGYVPCFIRFPGGSSNMISAEYSQGIMTTLSEQVQERGYQYYDWNVSSGDGADHTADELVAYSCEPTDAENIVLLCHDSATKQTTVEALPRIIEHFQSLGYSFEALDRSSWVCHHGVNN